MTVSNWETSVVLPSLQIDPISRATLALFAGASGDHNPIHIDIDAARSSGFEDVFAHGMLSMAYAARLVASVVPQDRIRSLRVRFMSVTPVHGRPTCTGKVVAVNEVDGERQTTIELHMALEDGTTTIVGEAVVALGKASSSP